MKNVATKHPASFRDPSGFVFMDRDGVLCRQVNRSYESSYRSLMDGGLYESLVAKGYLVSHAERKRGLSALENHDAYCVIEPERIPFISYPYEWCFSALRDAALLTLAIQKLAIEHDMTLKDASGYNVQFVGASPVFVDTLSFDPYISGEPWVAYGQFCRHFLSPLALMAYVDVSLNRLLALHIDGVPLDLAAKILPARTNLSLGLLMHLHLHARMVKAYSDTSKPSRSSSKAPSLSKKGLLSILNSLTSTVSRLKLRDRKTEWSHYYDDNSYSERGFDDKKAIVRTFLKAVTPKLVWDLGANTGVFSRIANEEGAYVCSFDVDSACVERAYLQRKMEKATDCLPLVSDLANPSPAIGWAHSERDSLAARGPADVVMALALMHHLVISNNVPFDHLAAFLSRLGHSLIIEYVPKSDPQVQRLLRSRKDIFANYDAQTFEDAFRRYYEIKDKKSVGDDGRELYLMAAR